MDRSGLPPGWTLAVAGGKGGCGKTTTTLGLAQVLASRTRRPIGVDGDVDLPNLHVMAGVDREPGLPAIADGRSPARVCRSSRRLSGVDVIPAGTGRPLLDQALAPVANLDRPTLVDTPAGAGSAVAAALRVADGTVLVATDAAESLEDAEKTAEMARALDAPPVVAVLRSPADPRPDRRVAGTPTERRVAGAPVEVVPDVSGPPLRNGRVCAAHDRVAALLGAVPPTPG